MEQHITTITHPKDSISPARQKQIKAEFAAAGVVAIFIPYNSDQPTPALDRFVGAGTVTLVPEPEADSEV
jgi:hypothetical protein